MKKVLALTFALVLLLSLFACGKKEAAKDNAPQQQGEGGFTPIKVEKSERQSDLEITELTVGKAVYKQEEAVTATLSWKGTPLEDAWIGIVPAHVPHGQEEVNDGEDIAYIYLYEHASGDNFVFEGLYLEPGEYTLRVHERDNGGPELCYIGFKVK